MQAGVEPANVQWRVTISVIRLRLSASWWGEGTDFPLWYAITPTNDDEYLPKERVVGFFYFIPASLTSSLMFS